MTKRLVGANQEQAKAFAAEVKELAEKPEPTLNLTEGQVQKVADFINYMYLNAEFQGQMKDFKKLNVMFADMAEHLKLIETHIFEVKRVRQAKKALE